MQQIELRSEKVRSIIGQIPPRIIRVGITLIFLLIIILLIGSYFFEYTYTIKTTAIIKKENEKNIILLKIPANEIEKVKTGQTVVINFDNIPHLYNEKFQSKIDIIYNNLIISNSGGYYNSKIILTDKIISESGKEIILTDEITVNAEIQTNKTNLFKRITEPFQFSKHL